MNKRKPEYRKYLDPAIVTKIESLELRAKLVVEGFKVGLHKSPYHGFSVEFSQHRPYMQGDSVRNIDWKVYGKRDRFFIKQYEEETNLITNIILDSSASMNYNYNSAITKLEYGKTLAAALSYLMINQQDSVGLSLYAENLKSYFPPRASRVYLTQILAAIENVNGSQTTNTAESLNAVAEKIRKRGLVIVISDLLDDENSIMNALKHLHFKKNEVIVFQLLDPSEINFGFGKEALFVDLESGEKLNTQPYQIQKAYIEAFYGFRAKMKKECLQFGIEYNLITTDTPFDKALFSYFKKRKQLH